MGIRLLGYSYGAPTLATNAKLSSEGRECQKIQNFPCNTSRLNTADQPGTCPHRVQPPRFERRGRPARPSGPACRKRIDSSSGAGEAELPCVTSRRKERPDDEICPRVIVRFGSRRIYTARFSPVPRSETRAGRRQRDEADHGPGRSG